MKGHGITWHLRKLQNLKVSLWSRLLSLAQSVPLLVSFIHFWNTSTSNSLWPDVSILFLLVYQHCKCWAVLINFLQYFSLLLCRQIQCEQPNNSLYTFTGNLIIEKQTLPLSPDQLLLLVWSTAFAFSFAFLFCLLSPYMFGVCNCMNTEYIVGAAIFTGHETKVSFYSARLMIN